MDIISSNHKQIINIPDCLKKTFLNKKFCFFDIETTGFSRVNNHIILIGVLYPENDSITIKQYFAESLDEEKHLLSSFAKFITDFDILVNYNGETFDIPFVNSKLLSYGLDLTIEKSTSLDLMKVVKKNKDLLELDNCKLKTVEKYLGIERQDQITGKESVELYNNFLVTKDNNIKKVILKHNYDDIYYLPNLLKIYNKIAEKNKHSFYIKCSNKDVVVYYNHEDINLKKNSLLLTGYTEVIDFSSQIYYGDSYTFEWEPKKGIFKLNIPLLKGTLSNGNKCYYINTNDYIINLKNQDKIKYNIPENIIIIKDKNKCLIKNINMLIKETLSYLFSNI